MRGYTTVSRDRRGILILLLLALAGLILAACGGDDDGSATAAAPSQSAATPESAFPLTLVDDDGASLTLHASPQRLVAVLPSVVDLVIDLGQDGRIIGTDDFSLDRLPQTASIGGNNFVYNLEALAQLEPDLIIAAQDGTDDLRAGARELGLPIFVLDFPASIAEVLTQLGTIGRLLGVTDAAETLVAGLQARIDAVAAGATDVSPLRVYLEVDQTTPSQPYTIGPGSIHDEILTLAGGVNIFADAAIDFPQVNWEAIITRDPEVILLLDSKEFAGELTFNPVSVEQVGQRTGWDLISAVRGDQVVPLPNDLFSVGVGLVDALEQVAAALDDARRAAAVTP